MSKNRAQVIRELAEKDGGQLFLRQIYGAFGAVTKAERQAVYGSLRMLMRTGQMKRIGDWGNGIYKLTRGPRRVEGEGRHTLWRVVRINRDGFTIDDLVLQSGCKPSYAEEYLRSLRRDGFIERRKGKAAWRLDGNRRLAVYRLVKDQLEPPANTLGIQKWQKRKEKKRV